jgi:flagellar hook-basal body complex protein FliE
VSISPIGAVSAAIPVTPPTPAVAPASGDGFGDVISKALDGLTTSQDHAAQMSQLAATGDLPNVSDLTIATTEAQLATTLTTAVRDKAVAAFNSIMSMPL